MYAEDADQQRFPLSSLWRYLSKAHVRSCGLTDNGIGYVRARQAEHA